MTDEKNNAGDSPLGRHHRKASVGLSPFWADEANNNNNNNNDKDVTGTPDKTITATTDYDNEAIGSPKVSERGIIDFPMDAIAFFPLPVDDCASNERALPPEKRPSRRASTTTATSRAVAPVPEELAAAVSKVPDAVEDTIGGGGDNNNNQDDVAPPLSPDGATKQLIDLEGGLPPELVVGVDKVVAMTSVTSDSSVAAGDQSFLSEFSENTAGSKF